MWYVVCVCHSVMPDSVIPCMGETDGLQYFFRQKYWVGLPFPFPGDLPNPGIDLLHLQHWQADSSPLSDPESPEY